MLPKPEISKSPSNNNSPKITLDDVKIHSPVLKGQWGTLAETDDPQIYKPTVKVYNANYIPSIFYAFNKFK